MVLTGYYNKANKTVIITKKNVENPEVKIVDNVTILAKDGEVVGLNIKTEREFTNHIVDLRAFASEIKTYMDIEEYSAPFVYGKIVSCEKHPKSEKLQICQIDVNQDELIQIVCGASNCQADNIAIVAMVGAIMPTGLAIVPSKLIDVPSNGMLCSEYELGLISEKKKGIKLFELGTKEIGQMIN